MVRPKILLSSTVFLQKIFLLQQKSHLSHPSTKWLILSAPAHKLTHMSRHVIINADDFGLAHGVNRGIFRAHTQGVLTSATLMAAAPAAEEAIELSRQMPDLGIGIHLNLLEGKPVSTDPKVALLLKENGEFATSTSTLAIKSLTSRRFIEAIEIELAAQIKWVLDRKITPTHLDSHKHAHAFWSIWPIACRLADRFGIKAVRWPHEPAWVARSKSPPPTNGGTKRAAIVRIMAKTAKKRRSDLIKNQLLFGVAHTGRIDIEFWKMVAKDAAFDVAEIMTHPGYTEGLNPEKTRLIEQRVLEMDTLCTENVKRILHDASIDRTHYGKI